MAAIDLDWLGWYGAPVAWDEHEDPRLTLENLGAMRDAYLRVGVRRFVLAGTVRDDGQLARLRATIAMPLTVVGLDVPAAVVEARLAGDPNASRADDLAVAMAELAGGGAAADRRLARPGGSPGRGHRRRRARPPRLARGRLIRRPGRVILGRPGAVR